MADTEMVDSGAQGGSASQGLTPIAILVDELKNEDIALRLNALRRLATIARAIGPLRTRNELIPFLAELAEDDEDEVLLAMAEELGGRFVECVGGAEFAHTLLIPLENLAAVEETMVREKAVESIRGVAELMPRDQVLSKLVPLAKSLAKGDWFTARASACGIVCHAYAVLTRGDDDDASRAVRAELPDIFCALCKDPTPMVRRAAAANLGALVEAAGSTPAGLSLVQEVLLPALKDQDKDDQDSVRLLSVENVVAFAKVLPVSDHDAQLWPIVRNALQDKSWRVRYMAAQHFTALCTSLCPPGESKKSKSKSSSGHLLQDLLPAFVRLLKDPEAEVRTAAALKVSDMGTLLADSSLVKAELMPCVNDLSTDPNQHVRAALASVVMGLAPILGKDCTVQDGLVDVYLRLLKDDFPEVRLNVISKLDAVNEVIGIDQLCQSLLPAIVELAEDRQWRVRLAIVEYIPLLASQLGVEFFDEKLANLCMSWLGDSVHSVRVAAAHNLSKLVKCFGDVWAQQNIVPKVLTLFSHPNYLYRMTTLYAIAALAPALGAEQSAASLLPLVIKLGQDTVPNIRFNVAKTLQQMLPHLEAAVIVARVKPALQALADSDPDRDVKFYAQQALAMC